MKNFNQFYLTALLLGIFGQLTRCMDVPNPDPAMQETSDFESDISIEIINGELHKAVYETERPDLVEALLAKNADPNAKLYSGISLLHFAAVAGNAQIARILLKYGAEINARTKRSLTPLDYAKIYKADAVAETLLAAHATPSFPNPKDGTPLERAMVGYAMLNRDSRRRESQERKSMEKRKSNGK
jgi:hypothetical protein